MPLSSPPHAAAHANAALLVIYGVLLLLFLLRFLRQRRVRSLAVVLLTVGWVLLALGELHLLNHFALHSAKGVGAVLGLFLLVLLVGVQLSRGSEG